MKHFSRKRLIPLVGVFILILISVVYAFPVQQDLEYEIIRIDQAPAVIYEIYESQKFHRGYSVNSYAGFNYILITMGETPTGGHSIQINNVYKSKGSLVIKTDFLKPDQGEMVTTAITYPAIVIKVSKDENQVKIKANEKALLQRH